MKSGKQTFPRDKRLLKPAEFEAVFAHRCSWRTPLFQILAMPNDKTMARLGMVVSKRALPRAVDRNRMRRKIREVFRRLVVGLPAQDIIVRPLSGQSHPDRVDGETLSNEPAWNQLLEQALIRATEKCRS